MGEFDVRLIFRIFKNNVNMCLVLLMCILKYMIIIFFDVMYSIRGFWVFLFLI